MQGHKFIALMMICSAAWLGGCNFGASPPPTVDVVAIQTQAMETVNAQFAVGQTQTAAIVPPTSLPSFTPFGTATRGIGTPLVLGTPLAGFTPLTTPIPTIATLAGAPAVSFPVGCNDAQFIGETKPFDKAEVVKFKEFSKGWQFLNK